MQTQIVKMINDFEHGRLSRRQLIAHLTGMFVASLGATIAYADQQSGRTTPNPADSTTTFDATDLNHIALSVSDVQRSQRLAGALPGREARPTSLLLQHRELRSSRCGRETQSRRPHSETRRRTCVFRRSGRHRMSSGECVMPGHAKIIAASI